MATRPCLCLYISLQTILYAKKTLSLDLLALSNSASHEVSTVTVLVLLMYSSLHLSLPLLPWSQPCWSSQRSFLLLFTSMYVCIPELFSVCTVQVYFCGQSCHVSLWNGRNMFVSVRCPTCSTNSVMSCHRFMSCYYCFCGLTYSMSHS